jgi:hypothetical protein
MSARDQSRRGRRRPPAPQRSPSGRSASERETAPFQATPSTVDPISDSPFSLHQLFEQQARQMLDNTDLNEEQKQNILIAMSCPCCGAGAMSYTAKLKR